MNLHNVGGLFDQFPRTLLTLAALVGGIAVPLLVTTKRLRIDPDRLQGWIWPTFVCIPTCLLALAPKAMGKAAKLIDLDKHSGEHPRIGATDVVPFVPISGVTMEECVGMAQRVVSQW